MLPSASLEPAPENDTVSGAVPRSVDAVITPTGAWLPEAGTLALTP